MRNIDIELLPLTYVGRTDIKDLENLTCEDRFVNKCGRFKKPICFITFAITAGAALVFMIYFTMEMLAANYQPASNTPIPTVGQYCVIRDQGSVLEPFPPWFYEYYQYVISFNTTTMQANYAFYISTGGENSAQSYFKNDPYEYDKLTDNDYDVVKYDRGQLVPNADYGNATFYMPNVVPLDPTFNQQTWRLIEEYIQRSYVGKLIYRGCKYDLGTFITTPTQKTMYIPLGCYYVILDTSELYAKSGTLLDYGYYLNDNTRRKGNDDAPYWLECF